jgi:hypothetical protein
MMTCVEAGDRLRVVAVICLAWLMAGATAFAGGPRWVTGPPYFSTSGQPVVWYTKQPLYFTDPGDLSSYVNHAAADALVAAAANVWNVPTASLVLGYGGALSEHLSAANVFLGSNGLVFPADVQSSNYLAKQIAVIYDTDGSVTDLLLGNGASDPSGCRQNAVTESVDSIVPAGFIEHALLVLNGRCTGPAPEQQMQMQYQLMRAFGRVLGLGWSQVNDNVFTGSPAPTYYQALNWPIMHPIDIICGLYTYQCLPQPFTLRMDDLSALGMLYFIPQNTAPPGKTDTLYYAQEIDGKLSFPTMQGMQGVNVVTRRLHQFWSVPEAWQTVSSVTGYGFKGANSNPINGAVVVTPQTSGTTDSGYEGYFDLRRIPMLDGTWQNVYVDTEAVNPLYTGPYTVGPYVSNQVAPSGSDAGYLEEVAGSYRILPRTLVTLQPASSCNSASDGTQSAPAAVATGGWWTGQLCAYGHTAWSALTVKANRSFTIEATAQDEQGFATTAKAMPVIGVWNSTDAQGSKPSVAAAVGAFNGAALGMTTLTVQNTQPKTLRIAIADERGDGRPDYGYQARVLYADSIAPSTVAAEGGTVTITGMGFRTGNVVTVHSVPATVSSWTATSIVATVPASSVFGFTTAQAVDVTVKDLSTGGTTVMTGALTYAAPVPAISLVSAPSGAVFVGDTTTTPFAVKVLDSDGITPMAHQDIVFTASGGAVQFDACGASSCTVSTDASGLASTTVTAMGVGNITLSAASSYGTERASFIASTRVRTIDAVVPVLYVAADATVLWTPQVRLADNSASVVGVAVDWQATSGGMVVYPLQSQTDTLGVAQTSATSGQLAAGVQATASACAWTTVCTSFAAEGVDPKDWRLEIVGGAGQSVRAADTLATVMVRVVDSAEHPVAGAAVEIHQSIDAWEMPCPDRGHCPVPPVEEAEVSSATSGVDGIVSITPMQIAGAEEVTNIVAAAGTQGFVSLSLEKQP